MSNAWKVLHLELTEGIPTLPFFQDCEGLYMVFWWHGIPLGHRVISAAQLPMPSSQLVNLAAQAITESVGDQLLPQGFRAPLSEHFAPRSPVPPDFHSVLALKRPLAELAERWSKPVDGSARETVSVVICTRNRPTELARCLESIEALSDRPEEIVIVDNAPSTHETHQLVAQYPGVHYVLEPRPGLSVARNTGIRRSEGTIIAFTDDDVIVHPDWIMRLRESFQTPKVMAVTGMILPGELETESQLAFEVGQGNFGWGYRARTFDRQFFRATRHLGVPVWRIGAGANMAFRRQVFDLVGNFDERLGAGASGCSEDSEMWYRILAAGWLCHYEPRAVVHHYHRRNLKGLRRQMYHYMRGHVSALLIQFEKHGHWGNLFRLIVSLPKYYLELFLVGLLRGFGLRHRAYFEEVLGSLAGITFYLWNRTSDGHRSSRG